eukprot:GHVS01058103.1.p1 GENE.GHVS01058103.1~~GHVS01058103.1.p1  ORF type:complete len:874 (-),score=125.80 GHVS01058103.1:1060-3441(-)
MHVLFPDGNRVLWDAHTQPHLLLYEYQLATARRDMQQQDSVRYLTYPTPQNAKEKIARHHPTSTYPPSTTSSSSSLSSRPESFSPTPSPSSCCPSATPPSSSCIPSSSVSSPVLSPRPMRAHRAFLRDAADCLRLQGFAVVDRVAGPRACAALEVSLRRAWQKERYGKGAGHWTQAQTSEVLRNEQTVEETTKVIRSFTRQILSAAAACPITLSLQQHSLFAPVNPGLDVTTFDEPFNQTAASCEAGNVEVAVDGEETVGVVLFPNLSWTRGDKGRMRLFFGPATQSSSSVDRPNSVASSGGVYRRAYVDIAPVAGRAVIFRPDVVGSQFDLSYGRTFGLVMEFSAKKLDPVDGAGTARDPSVADAQMAVNSADITGGIDELSDNQASSSQEGAGLADTESAFHSAAFSPYFDTITEPQLDDLQAYRLSAFDAPTGLASISKTRHICSTAFGHPWSGRVGRFVKRRLSTVLPSAVCSSYIRGRQRGPAAPALFAKSPDQQNDSLNVDDDQEEPLARHVIHGSAAVPGIPRPAAKENAGNKSTLMNDEDKEIQRNIDELNQAPDKADMLSYIREGKFGQELGSLFRQIEEAHEENNKRPGVKPPVLDEGLDMVDQLVEDPPEDALELKNVLLDDSRPEISPEEKQPEFSKEGAPLANTKEEVAQHGQLCMDQYFKEHGFKSTDVKHGITLNNKAYHWKENLDKIEVWIPIEPDATASDVKFSLRETHLKVAEKLKNGSFVTIVNGELFAKVDVSNTHWLLNGDFERDAPYIHIMSPKRKRKQGIWNVLFKKVCE